MLKADRAEFFGKILTYPEIAQKDPKWPNVSICLLQQHVSQDWLIIFFDILHEFEGPLEVGLFLNSVFLIKAVTAFWLAQLFILLRSIKWVPRISGNLVVKSKLPRRSGSVALRQFLSSEINPVYATMKHFVQF